jgi:hypothetical protein
MTDDKNFVEDLSPGAFADALASKPHVAGGWEPINVHSDIVDTLRDPSLGETIGVDSALLHAAADEIERLREQLSVSRYMNARLEGWVG